MWSSSVGEGSGEERALRAITFDDVRTREWAAIPSSSPFYAAQEAR